MHGVDSPHHRSALAPGGLQQTRQARGDLVRAEAAVQGQAARLIVRVQGVDQAQQFVRLHGRADLHANRVLDAAHELDMGVVQLARALADPQQVRGAVVPVARGGIDAGHGLLITQQQRLVAGEELHLIEARIGVRIDADGPHEGQGFGDLVRQGAVARALRAVVDKAQGPLVDVHQVGVAA